MYLRKVFNKQNIETFNGVFSICHPGCLCGCFALKCGFLPSHWWDYFIRDDLCNAV